MSVCLCLSVTSRCSSEVVGRFDLVFGTEASFDLSSIFASYFTQNTYVHYYNTREKYSLHLDNPHTDFGKRLVKFKGSRLWNNLPDSVKSAAG